LCLKKHITSPLQSFFGKQSLFIERERVVVRDTTVLGVIETKVAVLKVLRQCPLVLLVEVRLGICSILILK
jgi:hypothetical protein